ncbi:Cyclic di-GMP phosphodiesterase response regulator RpfG [Anoxybacillus thermarum]|uniref:Cyclic di-GMP phosphodiesterase response regulator RpfG n=1 Tax=Anoxybacillus thermarum TaxID=404937 RepID=A0A0D0S1G6_9BACL|nr:HD-GYP domain-containing protein [Anoxybacillus thermarum]KIQ95420.1 Cyclic di-GMP phosphodiesterase response regulator RpfG [Anoxybacillus thermarum]
MLLVKTAQLQEGCILAEDVIGKSNRVIVPKNTVLTPKLLTVLQKFLVTQVRVQSVLVDGSTFRPSEIIQEDVPKTKVTDNKDILTLYLEAVQQYKQMFQGWQSGLPIDIGKVRHMFMPLFEKVLESEKELLFFHHYSTKSEYLFHHAVTVGLLSGVLAKKLQYAKGDYYQVAIAGLLSDCGMAKVDPKILYKSTALTPMEYKDMRQHTVYGYKMVQKITALQEGVKLAILQHHERNDGSGYLLSVQEEKIHPYSKIVAVADVYHAMISERPYRNKQSPFKVFEQIHKDCFGKFDLSVVRALASLLMTLSIGARVKLSNEQIGEIIFFEQDSPNHPMVKIIETNKIISLKDKKDLFIEDIIK